MIYNIMDNYRPGCPPRMQDGRFLTDHRTPSARELHTMSINGIVRSGDYRAFLQKNGEQIQDGEWSVLRQKKSCRSYPCFHDYPLRTTPGDHYKEMKLYNMVKTSRDTSILPRCKQVADYRMSHTKQSGY